MKNFKIYIIALFLFGVLYSCENELDVLPNDAQTEVDFLNDPNNAIQLVNGIYSIMLQWDMYSFSWIGLTSITSDDADKGSTPGDTGSDKNKLDALNFESNMASLNDIWNSRYAAIYRANNALFYLEQLSIEESLKNRLIGETRFLRGLMYFDLVRCFGGVPVVTSKIDINDLETVNKVVYVRKSVEEVYAQIEEDLADAATRLPNKSEYKSEDLGRATKGAAIGLLAKAYLYQKKWQKAFDKSGEVVNSGQYSLMENYADVWKEIGENGTESIFEVQATLNKGLQGYTDVQGGRGTPDYGWGFNSPSLTLSNSYEPGDSRRGATIIFVPSTLWDGFEAPVSWNNPRYNYKSYQSNTAESWNGNKSETAKNLRILKYSDVLLIRAEAALQLGNAGEAISNVNALRTRAGLNPKTSITLQQLYDERRWEMAMEHDRWFDLVRTGQAAEKMALDGKTFKTGTHEVFPIPADQITQSGGRLIQNQGYN
ncbi:MAG: RagB/SusD family nutrient uptake outer membrane protein [Saprospiraceae bacterium]|nr:RagB/SusD family nutrient uptake outer membrane protein [Saprospiraceae bacterium]